MYKKNTESVPPFQVEYGLSLILTRCVVSNGSKTLALKWHVVNRVLELCCFEWFQNDGATHTLRYAVLELCCFEWFQNYSRRWKNNHRVLELCCFEWFQNYFPSVIRSYSVLELCCFEWFQNYPREWKNNYRVLELCCFEWFQNFCYHNFRLTSLRTHLIIKESSIKI